MVSLRAFWQAANQQVFPGQYDERRERTVVPVSGKSPAAPGPQPAGARHGRA